MKEFNFKETPKFKSPEEELGFLKKMVEHKESELKNRSEEAREDQEYKKEAAEEVINEYKQVKPSEVLEKEVPESEAEQVVLNLAPERHDHIMEEILGIIEEKGVKNAMAYVEKMNNPHIEDDFHRFLVQYLQAVNSIKGLKEDSELFKALNMKLFEVTLPEVEEEGGFKEVVALMEQFYSGMFSLSADKDMSGKNYFSLEVALSSENDSIVFYCAVPNSKVQLFEKQLTGLFPKAKAVEAGDDYNIFNDDGHTAVANLSLQTYKCFPLKTYDNFESDPLNVILNIFSKLKTVGEGAAFQVMVSPVGDLYDKRYKEALKKVKKGEKVKNALTDESFANDLLKEMGDFFDFSEKKEEDKDVDDDAVSAITEKIESKTVAVNLRILSSADTKERAQDILDDMKSAFHQFSNPKGNELSIKEIKSPAKIKEEIHNFTFRMFKKENILPLNLKELSTLFHFPQKGATSPQLRQAKSGTAPAPMDMPQEGTLLGFNEYRGSKTKAYLSKEDRVRHFYVIGQTGTGKTTILKNMIAQDIAQGHGCCFIDPHGSDVQDILGMIPPERADDVIYFDPAYTQRPMAFNMMEYDPDYPEQKIFVINELMGIFDKLFDLKSTGGPMFEQYFRNSAGLVMEHPESGNTLLEIGRVLSDKAFRDYKLSKSKNPVINQFWKNAEATTGDAGLENFVPYITSKFDVFVSNEIMRPIIAQEKSSFDFRKVMDEKKILLVNLSKGRLGDINSNLIGLILVGKILMAALSRVDNLKKEEMNDFYLYIDEFQNVTTDSISTILSEARKYRLSLNVAHQYISQLDESIKNAVFGNVGSMAVYRVSTDDASYLENTFAPTFEAGDITRLDNFNAYLKVLINGQPSKPFNIQAYPPPESDQELAEKIKEMSYQKYGRPREEVEKEVSEKFENM